MNEKNPCFFLLLALSSFIQTEKKKDALPQAPAFLHAKDLKITINYFNEQSIPRQIGSDCSERYAFDTMAFYSKNMVCLPTSAHGDHEDQLPG
jgi:hypothetical protein